MVALQENSEDHQSKDSLSEAMIFDIGTSALCHMLFLTFDVVFFLGF